MPELYNASLCFPMGGDKLKARLSNGPPQTLSGTTQSGSYLDLLGWGRVSPMMRAMLLPLAFLHTGPSVPNAVPSTRGLSGYLSQFSASGSAFIDRPQPPAPPN